MLLLATVARVLPRALAVTLAGVAIAAAMACGTDPVGVESCRKIEIARCENANACGIDLSKPVHRGDTPSLDVGACKRYYEDACLHGLVIAEDPGAVVVDACVEAINDPANGCEVVKAPETHPKCSFLLPPAAPPPAPAVDAATE